MKRVNAGRHTESKIFIYSKYHSIQSPLLKASIHTHTRAQHTPKENAQTHLHMAKLCCDIIRKYKSEYIAMVNTKRTNRLMRFSILGAMDSCCASVCLCDTNFVCSSEIVCMTFRRFVVFSFYHITYIHTFASILLWWFFNCAGFCFWLVCYLFIFGALRAPPWWATCSNSSSHIFSFFCHFCTANTQHSTVYTHRM